METGQDKLGPGDKGFPDCTNDEHQDISNSQEKTMRRTAANFNQPVPVTQDVTQQATDPVKVGDNKGEPSKNLWNDHWQNLMAGPSRPATPEPAATHSKAPLLTSVSNTEPITNR